MKLTKWLNLKVKMLVRIGFLTSLITSVSAQTLSLEDCQEKAKLLSPLKRQEQYLASIDALNQEIVQNNWLPAVNFQARASYQSDVFGLPFSLPGSSVPQIPKDQYQLTLNLNQNLYDGGTTKANGQLENAKTQAQQAQLEVNLYQINQVINDLYFGILTLDKSDAILQSVLKELDNQLHKAESAVKNGVLLPSELKMLQKQKLTSLQQLTELKMRRLALLKILSDWIDQPLSPETELSIPGFELAENDLARPELTLFNQKIGQLEAQQSVLSTYYKPKLSAFATAGFGSPNPYNFFETNMSGFYIVGAQLRWQPWDWNSTKKQKSILRINQDIIRTEQENFEKNINNQLIQQQSEIELLAASLKTDEELVKLQKDITATATAQFTEGVISATDYLSELNAQARTELQFHLHQIQLIKAQITKRTISGI